MPIFEFRCQGCGHNFEIFYRGDQTSASCPGCGSGNITRKFSSFGFSTGRSGQGPAAATHSSCGNCASHQCSGCHH